jgi:hypothetical protein
MSEIASAEGARLGSDVLKGIGSGIHVSEARWPRQARPLVADRPFSSKKPRAALSSYYSGTLDADVRSTRVDYSSASANGFTRSLSLVTRRFL